MCGTNYKKLSTDKWLNLSKMVRFKEINLDFKSKMNKKIYSNK